MTNFFVFTHFYFTTYKLCIKAHSDENLQTHSLQALKNTRKKGKNYTIFTPKCYKRYCRTWKLRNLCKIYAENTQDTDDICIKIHTPYFFRCSDAFGPGSSPGGHTTKTHAKGVLLIPLAYVLWKNLFGYFSVSYFFRARCRLPREWSWLSFSCLWRFSRDRKSVV